MNQIWERQLDRIKLPTQVPEITKLSAENALEPSRLAIWIPTDLILKFINITYSLRLHHLSSAALLWISPFTTKDNKHCQKSQNLTGSMSSPLPKVQKSIEHNFSSEYGYIIKQLDWRMIMNKLSNIFFLKVLFTSHIPKSKIFFWIPERALVARLSLFWKISEILF